MESTSARAIDPIDASIGERVRHLRRLRGASLQAVAQRADLSVGYLSQIERGLSSPSVRDLIRIAGALETELSLFFDAASTLADGNDTVVRLAERREVAFHEGITKQLLTPHESHGVQLYLVIIEPGGRTGESLYSHAGEEAGVVLQGRLLLTVESADHVLNEGDSFRFLSTRPHRFASASAMVTRVLWVNTQPRVRA